MPERTPAAAQFRDCLEQTRRRKLERRKKEAEPLDKLVLESSRSLMQFFTDFAGERAVRRVRKEVESLHELRQRVSRDSEPGAVQPAPPQ